MRTIYYFYCELASYSFLVNSTELQLESLGKYKLTIMFIHLRLVVWFLITVTVQISTPSFSGSKNYICLLALAPFPDSQNPPAFSDGFSLIPAVLLAIEHINQQQDILPNHTLQAIIGDSGCEQIPKAALAFIPGLTKRNMKPVAVIGPSCSESSLYVANLGNGNHFNIIQTAFGTTPELDNHAIFSNTFGLISSTRLYANILANLAKCNNWTRVSILYEPRQYFIDTLKVIEDTFEDMKINISFTGNIVVSPLTIPLTTASHHLQGTRIIIILASSNLARSVACMASALHFTFPSYQFIYINRRLQDFLIPTLSLAIEKNEEYECSRENIKRGLHRSVLLRYSLHMDNLGPTPSGRTVAQVVEEYSMKIKGLCSRENNSGNLFLDGDESVYSDKVEEYCSAGNRTLQESIFAYPYYDAVWAIALSLNNTLNTVHGDLNKNSSILQNEMYNLNFQGVSTYVTFNKKTGHVNNNVDLLQVKSDNSTIRTTSNNGSIICHDNLRELLFINDTFPIQYETLNGYSAATGIVLITTLTIMTAFLHILNIAHRRYPKIKASSPLLNHFIFAGCYAIILSILLETIDLSSQSSLACNFSFYLSNLSYDLIFGTLCVKLWRLYNIFKHTFEKQRLLSNYALVTYINIIIVLNGVFHLWMIKYNKEITVLFTEVIETENGHVQMASITCQFQNLGYLFIPSVFHTLLTFATLVLCILNRNIKFKDFRNSRKIIILAYFLAILWCLTGTMIIIYMTASNITYLLYIMASSCTVMFCHIFLIFPITFPIQVCHTHK